MATLVHVISSHRRAPRWRRLSRGAVVGSRVVLLLGALACSQGPDAGRELAWRWIESEGPGVFDLAEHQVPTECFKLAFPATGSMPEGWSSKRSGTGNTISSIEGPVNVSASDVREIVVRVDHSGAGYVGFRLMWAPPGGEYSARRTIQQGRRLPWKRTISEFRYLVVEHPEWKGEVGRLAVFTESTSGARVAEIVGYTGHIDMESLAPDLAGPWKVDVASDIRNGLVSVPGTTLRSRCAVPEEGGELRLAYAHLERSRVPIHYRVTLADGGRRRQVFHATLDPGELPLGGWKAIEVDLAPWAGKSPELILETGSDSPADELRGLPVWANPEIVAPSRREPRINVILISIDTLRADRMSLYGHDRPTTPHLEAWAKRRATVFKNTVAQASWTLPSHTSMLSGVGAFRHGTNYSSAAPRALKMLAEYLREAGYTTLAVTGGAWVHPQYQFGQGFDRFQYWSGIDRETGAPIDGAERELDVILGQATAMMREHAHEPFFLFLHTYDIHYRSSPRQPYFSEFSDLDYSGNLRWRAVMPSAENGFKRDKYRVLRTAEGPVPLPPEQAALPADIYDSRIAYLDSRLPVLLDELENLGLDDRTMVVFTSDHGEMLGEHGLYAHLCLYDENLMIPLIIAPPGGPPHYSVIETQVRSIDIVPTVLDFLHMPPDPVVEGTSLAELMRSGEEDGSRPAWSYSPASNYGMSLRLDNRAKLILNNTAWAPVAGDAEFYRVDLDPDELQDVPDAEEISSMRRQLAEAYLGSVSGVRLTFDNPGSKDFELTIQNLVNQINLKTVDLPHESVRTRKGGGGAAIVVPAGSGYTLILEHDHSGDHSLKITATAPSAAETLRQTIVDLDEDLRNELTLVWTGKEWTRAEEGGTRRLPSISLQLVGALPREQDVEATIGEGLKERLRALGYIE